MGAQQLLGMLPMAVGAGSEILAPGNPVGMGAMASGGAGGGLGSLLGGGGGGGLMSGLSNLFGPSSSQQSLLNLSAGQFGGAGADPLLQQGAGDLATYEGVRGAPGFRPDPNQAPVPTSQMYGGAAPSAAPSALGTMFGGLGGGQQPAPPPATPPPPAFKAPISQSPIAPKGQTPTASVTPSVPQVPSPPTAPTPAMGPNAMEILKLMQGG